jgi:hypothetical protein
MRYVNEPCGHCGLLFGEDDTATQIAVCPVCGAPVHRACWAEHGGCAFAALHGDFVWKPQNAAPPQADFDPKTEVGTLCPVCGENCSREATACPRCGTHFAEYADMQRRLFEQGQGRAGSPAQPQREPCVFNVNNRQVREGELLGRADDAQEPLPAANDGADAPEGFVSLRRLKLRARVPVEEAAIHIRSSRRRVERYLGRFEANHALGWNWAAFVFGSYWYFYRKLYKAGLAFAGILLALNFALLASPVTAHFENEGLPRLEAAYSAAAAAYRTGDDSAQSAAGNQMLQALRQTLRENRWYFFANAAILLGTHIAAALLADRLLRRKVWVDISIAHVESKGSAPEQRQLRQRILARRGGISFLAPMLFYWANAYVPAWLIMLIEKITG